MAERDSSVASVILVELLPTVTIFLVFEKNSSSCYPKSKTLNLS